MARPEEASSWAWSLKRQGSNVARLDTGQKVVPDLDLLENESLVNPKVRAGLTWGLKIKFLHEPLKNIKSWLRGTIKARLDTGPKVVQALDLQANESLVNP